jgi:hypothetical protein
MNHLPFIAVEIVLVFGGAMAFAWWQFRDLAKERRKREARRADGAAGSKEAGRNDAA